MIREISSKIDYVYEGIGLLAQLGGDEDYHTFMEKLQKRYGNAFEDKELEISFLYEAEAKAQKEFAQDMETVEFYFSSKDKRECPANLLLLWDHFACNRFETVKELEDYLFGLSEEEYAGKFSRFIMSYGSDIREEDESEMTCSAIDVIRLIMGLEVPMEERFHLQELYVEREKHIRKILLLVEKATSFLKNYEERIREIINRFIAYWTKELGEMPFNRYMIEKYNMGMKPNEQGVILSPSIFVPVMLGMNADMDDDGNYRRADYATAGILFGEHFDITCVVSVKGAGYIEQAGQIMKLLSDRSKFEILCYIKDRSAYGSELAKYLNLTTATISHHMSTLMQKGLVRIDKVNNRVYYQADKKVIREFLEYCQQALLGE
ncbi:MAG: winged helix-turn-helix transcriptional regulator [Lachnospiraceae bacterium]|nr:winged helix-turn-helix transcriptional regulator [Lachnospiraceae bacterium]